MVDGCCRCSIDGEPPFSVVGHDRGGRVAYRLALDHPDRVVRLGVLETVPTDDMWRYAESHGGKDFGLTNWHWYFLAQPLDRPERIITADPVPPLLRRRHQHLSSQCAGRLPSLHQ
jgi:pimeloyl-ACP methyl ester carboxylesterase